MALNTTEVIGFLETLSQLMTTNQATLAAKGLNVTNWITETDAQKDDLVTENGLQEAAKATLRIKTTDTNNAQSTAYSSASTKLDAIIGVLGKNTEGGKQAARLRSNLLRQPRSNGNGASSSSSSSTVASSSSSSIAA